MPEKTEASATKKPKTPKEMLQQCEGILMKFSARMIAILQEPNQAAARQKIEQWSSIARTTIEGARRAHPEIHIAGTMEPDGTDIETMSMIFFDAARRMPRAEEQNGIVQAAATYRKLVEYYQALLTAIVQDQEQSFTLAPGIEFHDPPAGQQQERPQP